MQTRLLQFDADSTERRDTHKRGKRTPAGTGKRGGVLRPTEETKSRRKTWSSGKQILQLRTHEKQVASKIARKGEFAKHPQVQKKGKKPRQTGRKSSRRNIVLNIASYYDICRAKKQGKTTLATARRKPR